MNTLTAAACSGYANHTVPHWTGGIGVLKAATKSRHVVQALRLFLCLDASSYGRSDGESRKARRCRTGTPISIRLLTRLASGEHLKTACGDTIMHNHTQITPSALTISDISIRQDSEGRYCLNDLHKAAGGHKNHQPSNWLRTQQTQDLISEIELGSGNSDLNTHIRGIKKIGGRYGSTYVVKELVYAYAMWISASFSLKVIRAYDALQGQPKAPPSTSSIETFQVRVLTTFTRGDQPTQQIVPYDACVVSGTDLLNIKTFLNESVEIEFLPDILEAVGQRMARHFKYLEQATIKSTKGN